ncbi:hypothetical protein C808_02587 [Lachnospiraceae bacterium M18-1]|nr:hypothetical protein C808_02587 [Lachnospiraceae bacterium M18-1]
MDCEKTIFAMDGLSIRENYRIRLVKLVEKLELAAVLRI